MARRQETPATGSGLARVVALAVLLVLAVLVARARAQGPAPKPAAAASGAVVELVGALGVGSLVAVLVLLVAGRCAHRARLATGHADGPPRLSARQRAWGLAAVLTGLLVALGFQLLLTLLGAGSNRRTGAPPAHPPAPAPDAAHPQVWLALAALAVLVVLLAHLLRPGGTLTGPRSATPAQAALARAAAAGRAAVRSPAAGGARQAIIACFAAMERALAALGGELAPRDADTPAEVVDRVFGAAAVPRRPADELLELFRRARFSEHPMGELERDAADRALSAILAALPATRAWVR